jgi:AcrR family transcriptional regulator
MAAAFRVFADKGFGQVRIDDVCTAAGYTRGAFYSNFDSLEELFFTLYDESARLIAGQVTDALTARDINPGLEAVIERVTATLLLNRDWLLIKTDFLLHAARNPAVADRLAAHRLRRSHRSTATGRRPPSSTNLAHPTPHRATQPLTTSRNKAAHLH